METLRAQIRCGGRGPRTYRRAFPAASDLSRTFDDLGPLDGEHIVADSVLRLSDGPTGRRYALSVSPSGVIGFESKGLPVDVIRIGEHRAGFEAFREVPYHLNQRLLASKKTVGAARWGASSFDFTIADASRAAGVGHR